MPKIKTNRGAAKRFKTTAKGKFKRERAFANHIFTKKSRKRKRRLRDSTIVDAHNTKALKRLLPYV